MSLNEDQLPQGWSDGAQGYEEHFAGFTSLYADEMLDRLGVGAGTRLLDVAAGTGATSVQRGAAGRRGPLDGLRAGDGRGRGASPPGRWLRRMRSGGHGRPVARRRGRLDRRSDLHVRPHVLPRPPGGDARARQGRAPGGSRRHGDLGPGGLRHASAHRWCARGGAPGYRCRSATRRRPGRPWEPPRACRRSWSPAASTRCRSSRRRGGGTSRTRSRFFHEMPSWSSPVRPLFEQLPEELLDAAAAAFGDLVTAAGGRPGGAGIEMTALIGTGTVV